MEFQLVIENVAIFTVVCLKFQINVFTVWRLFVEIICRNFDCNSLDGHEFINDAQCYSVFREIYWNLKHINSHSKWNRNWNRKQAVTKWNFNQHTATLTHSTGILGYLYLLNKHCYWLLVISFSFTAFTRGKKPYINNI